MKQTVTCKCGHTIEVNLYGKSSERERAVYAYEHYKVCPACYKAATAPVGLPSLTGSDRQVSWANDIRARVAGHKYFAMISGETSAKWWIDNRDDLVPVMIMRKRNAPMSKSDLFREAHKITKQLVRTGISYQATFAMVLKELYAINKSKSVA